ncbi:hypothetical protein B1L04_06905 [Microcystis aeruginosa KW]|uniref:Uncharacterized protein n=1 Tax=Microcystis aeruginosa KW TaxID=1960155 RepID=A0A1V4BYE9_MICAE|nr:hypothetical protein B1L04_06905 [Microcystis aeruginosa KW]
MFDKVSLTKPALILAAKLSFSSLFLSLVNFSENPYIYLGTDSHYIKSISQVLAFVKHFG